MKPGILLLSYACMYHVQSTVMQIKQNQMGIRQMT